MKLTIRITISKPFAGWRARRAAKRADARVAAVFYDYLDKLPVDKALAELAAVNSERAKDGLPPRVWRPSA